MILYLQYNYKINYYILLSVDNYSISIFSYRPTLPVDYITKILGFTSQDDCVAFLIGSDAVLDERRTTMDCRPTQLKLSI